MVHSKCRVSKSRMSRRLHTGVNRKLCVTRWIGQTVVEIVIARRSVRGCAYEKASEGVEKSCVATRRKRGLRRGKSRSRGDKPRRSPSLRPPYPKTGRVRKLMRGERMFNAMRACIERIDGDLEVVWEKKGMWSEYFLNKMRKRWRAAYRSFRYSQSRNMVFGTSFNVFMSTRNPDVLEVPPLPPRPEAQFRFSSDDELVPPALPKRPTAVVNIAPPHLAMAGVVATTGPFNANPYRPLWPVGRSVPTVGDSQVESDRLGPNPCAWCRNEWEDEGETGECLRIQRCVRNPKTLAREKGQSLHRGNAKRGGRSRPNRR